MGKFPKDFRQMAVDRLNECENIVALAKELGMSRRLSFTWREKLEPLALGEPLGRATFTPCDMHGCSVAYS